MNGLNGVSNGHSAVSADNSQVKEKTKSSSSSSHHHKSSKDKHRDKDRDHKSSKSSHSSSNKYVFCAYIIISFDCFADNFWKVSEENK